MLSQIFEQIRRLVSLILSDYLKFKVISFIFGNWIEGSVETDVFFNRFSMNIGSLFDCFLEFACSSDCLVLIIRNITDGFYMLVWNLFLRVLWNFLGDICISFLNFSRLVKSSFSFFYEPEIKSTPANHFRFCRRRFFNRL